MVLVSLDKRLIVKADEKVNPGESFKHIYFSAFVSRLCMKK